MSQFFTSGGQSIGAPASVLPMNSQHWFPLGSTGWISLQSKGLSRVFCNTTVQKQQFFGTPPSPRPLFLKILFYFIFSRLISFIYFIFKLYIIVLVLPNIKMNPPQVYMRSPSWTLLPPPSPYHPSGSSQCTSPKHPVSCIEPGLATRFIPDILHVSMPFSQIFPPSPSLTESIRLFYTSESLLLSRTQGYCSKFHIYALVYCIGVFLSGLLHSV